MIPDSPTGEGELEGAALWHDQTKFAVHVTTGGGMKLHTLVMASRARAGVEVSAFKSKFKELVSAHIRPASFIQYNQRPVVFFKIVKVLLPALCSSLNFVLSLTNALPNWFWPFRSAPIPQNESLSESYGV